MGNWVEGGRVEYAAWDGWAGVGVDVDVDVDVEVQLVRVLVMMMMNRQPLLWMLLVGGRSVG